MSDHTVTEENPTAEHVPATEVTEPAHPEPLVVAHVQSTVVEQVKPVVVAPVVAEPVQLNTFGEKDHPDAAYIKSSELGLVVAKGLAVMYKAQPSNPVDFLAKWLLNYSSI